MKKSSKEAACWLKVLAKRYLNLDSLPELYYTKK